MCGRFAVNKTPQELAAECEAQWADQCPDIPSWNTCPSVSTAVLSNNKLHSWSWGLIPSWASSDKKQIGHLNARVESLTDKPSFKHLVGSKQCIIPCSGWFEWSKEGGDKIPWYFTRNDTQSLYMAGLWDLSHNNSGKPVYSFTIITKEAHKSISHIHDRMPLIIDRQTAGEWSTNSACTGEILDRSLEVFEFYTVSKKVNSVSNNSPDLIEEASVPRQGELFKD